MLTQTPFAPTQPASLPPRRTKAVAASKITVAGNSGIKIVRAVTIRRPARELYAFWRNLENLPKIIKHPVEIRCVSEVESRWSASAPFSDHRYEWTAFIINDESDSLIAWRSADDAEVAHAGSIRFEPAPGDEGTEVTVSFEYDPPGGKLIGRLAKISPEEPGRQVKEALRRFKALFEAGEIPSTDGQPVGLPQTQKVPRR